MSQKPLSLSPDLKRLRDEGYFVQIRGGLLVVRDVPYVNAQRQVQYGTLISSLTLAGDLTRRPDTHVAYFDGDCPCDANGKPISEIKHLSQITNHGGGVTSRHSFSSKPEGGYADYYHKMTTYVAILSGPAEVVTPGVSPRAFRAPEPEEDSVFNYTETASDRVGIGALTALLEKDRIGIVGLGGTGSYILDLLAKTPVREIHLFDEDEFLQHNAFRAPGAPSIEQLREVPRKVDYLLAIYSRMRKGIIPHVVKLAATNIQLLEGLTFVFLSMDAGEVKRAVVAKLEALGISFIDVGMGLELTEGSLGGILRVTASTPEMRLHVHQGRISFGEDKEGDIYATNIQVADLNALNAVLAVIKWKKLRGFYRDLEREHHMTYTTDGNMLLNGDQK